MAIRDRMRSAWNAFLSSEKQVAQEDVFAPAVSYSASSSPSRPRRQVYNERSIITSIYTRIAIDVSSIVFRHIKLDDSDRYLEDADSNLNNCLTVEANLDQAPRQFRQDLVLTLFDRGTAAIVPVDTTVDPQTNQTVDIYTLRVGEINAWMPSKVRVNVYNEAKGIRQDILLDKRILAIVENPLYGVMNEPNSTLQRLIRKLALLDSVDEQSSSGKLDIIIQLPYVIKSEARRQQAEQRRDDIEFQLKGSKYGIAYTDGTEKITQLNRPAENNLLKQIEYLTGLLYAQLGITEEVMNGTASEDVMLNYFNRTVEPIADAIKEAMQRAFIGPVRAAKKERIEYFRNPFKLVPVGKVAEIADKFTRNEIFTANEMRGYVGVPPSKDPKADKLTNSNMPQPPDAAPSGPSLDEVDSMMNQVFDGLSGDVDKLTKQLANG